MSASMGALTGGRVQSAVRPGQEERVSDCRKKKGISTSKYSPQKLTAQ